MLHYFSYEYNIGERDRAGANGNDYIHTIILKLQNTMMIYVNTHLPQNFLASIISAEVNNSRNVSFLKRKLTRTCWVNKLLADRGKIKNRASNCESPAKSPAFPANFLIFADIKATRDIKAILTKPAARRLCCTTSRMLFLTGSVMRAIAYGIPGVSIIAFDAISLAWNISTNSYVKIKKSV